MAKLKEEHLKEIKSKEEKLDLLKKQIAGAFKDNSWYQNFHLCSTFFVFFNCFELFLYRERQSQIDELSKELKRTQEEYDLIRFKLKGYKNKNSVRYLLESSKHVLKCIIRE
jgi:hypothetical protein